MRVYFVRHGESQLNAEKKSQFPSTPLSSQGLSQAQFVANRFLHIPIDKIITSPFTRALQTAQIISETTGVPFETNDLFVERRPPKELMGLPHGDPQGDSIRQQMADNFHELNWHYSNEENFFDILNRAKQAVQFIESEDRENLLIVSHGNFIRLLIAYMNYGQDLTSQIYEKILRFFQAQNTGITVCEYHDKIWHLSTWNDHAHLG